jgi:toxin ParE1/3/4
MNRPRREQKTPLSILWTDSAKSDLADIGDYISKDNPRAAMTWVEKLLCAVEQAADMPLSGRVVPEFQRPELREVIRGNYRIVYCVGEERIDVLTVFEGHRRLPDISWSTEE